MRTILICILLILSTWAHSEQYVINPEHSRIEFSIPYMGISKVVGSFRAFRGQFDLKSHKFSNIKFRASTSTINTNDKKRDLHLRKPDFFHASKYPYILFSTKDEFKISPNNKNLINGSLIIKNISNNVEIEVLNKGTMKDPWGKSALYLELKTQINRKDFSITWNKVLDNGGLLVGDLVKVKITVEAYPIGDKPSFSKFLIPHTQTYKRKELNQSQQSVKTNDVDIKDISIPPTSRSMIYEDKNSKINESNTNSINNHFSKVPTIFAFFIGFIVLILTGIWIKFKVDKLKKEQGLFQNSVVETLSDLFVIGLFFAFSVFMYNSLFTS